MGVHDRPSRSDAAGCPLRFAVQVARNLKCRIVLDLCPGHYAGTHYCVLAPLKMVIDALGLARMRTPAGVAVRLSLVDGVAVAHVHDGGAEASHTTQHDTRARDQGS